MSNHIICPKCKGSGVITVPGSKHVVKPNKDPWDIFEGRNYHHKLCTRCKGKGYIEIEIPLLLVPRRLGMTKVQ